MTRAFSLVECLTAITVVIVLSAILMAVVSQGRQSALRSADLEKMHQLGIAFNLYHDNEGGYMRSPRELRAVASLPDEEFVSSADTVPLGIGNARCKNGGSAMPSIFCTEFRRTFVSYGDLGATLQSWEGIHELENPGWLMRPMDFPHREGTLTDWEGPYQRLTLAGGVIVRHQVPKHGTSPDGLPYTKAVPMTLLCDPDAATLEKWFRPIPGEE